MTRDPLAPEAARALVLREVERLEGEGVALEDCLGRVTAAPVRSGIAIQPFDNSAMDGHALRSADAGGRGERLRLVGESRAGHPAPAAVGEGEAIRISTGAMVPEGADAVLPVEDSREEVGELLPARPVEAGENIRLAGEDVKAGQVLLERGTRIGAAEVAVLAAAGVAEIECARRPRVAILGSGDELVPPAEPLGPGQIHDSNTYALAALVREAGADPRHVAHLPDDPEATREAIAAVLSPAREADVLLVAGGVSVGRHDHVKGALAELGVEERFWRVAMRPGGPTWFGVLPREGAPPALVFGLPGNPVSAMVTFHLFAKPALRAMQGLDPTATRTRATLATAYRKRPGKAHLLRCRLELVDEGWRAHLTRDSQGSHVLTSMLGADAMAEIPLDAEEIEPGERIGVELLR
ncbi:MAG TPA: gephyrin-like molybdotransferase Glp [Solirubrobacterales bacterium]|nr:gephyrin-like molybdotransferase Glp [Solirubrobacterales bacterium]